MAAVERSNKRMFAHHLTNGSPNRSAIRGMGRISKARQFFRALRLGAGT
jgi:hypothetical protein